MPPNETEMKRHRKKNGRHRNICAYYADIDASASTFSLEDQLINSPPRNGYVCCGKLANVEMMNGVKRNENIYGRLPSQAEMMYRSNSVFTTDGTLERIGPNSGPVDSLRRQKKKISIDRLSDENTGVYYAYTVNGFRETTVAKPEAEKISYKKKDKNTKKHTKMNRKCETHNKSTSTSQSDVSVSTLVSTENNEISDRETILTPRSSAIALLSEQYPTPMPPPSFTLSRIGILRSRERNGRTYLGANQPTVGPIVMANGTIQVRLREGIRLDITVGKNIRVYNHRCEIAMTMGQNCENSAIIHPNGRVLQYGARVEILAYDSMGKHNYVRHAKIWYSGICFKSETCALSYLVDSAGIHSRDDFFSKLTDDLTIAMFYERQQFNNKDMIQEALRIVNTSKFKYENGKDIYDINGYHIVQSADGATKISRTFNRIIMQTNPNTGYCSLTTNNIHCTATMDADSHLFVRRNEKRIHSDGAFFLVRNGVQAAGLNEDNQLVVF